MQATLKFVPMDRETYFYTEVVRYLTLTSSTRQIGTILVTTGSLNKGSRISFLSNHRVTFCFPTNHSLWTRMVRSNFLKDMLKEKFGKVFHLRSQGLLMR